MSYIASHLIDAIKQTVRLFDLNRLVINAKILQTAEEVFIEWIATQFSTELSSKFNWQIKVRKAQD